MITPYTYTKAEIQIIKTHFTTHTDWSNNNFDQIKEKLIAYLRVQQDNKCFYCKWELGYDIKNVEIDHIAFKSKYEKFTFHPKNLILSCPGCNNGKGISDALKKSIVNYPSTGSNFLIVHAYFDEYSNHIEIHNDSVYEGRTSKGCKTIDMCKIYRLKDVLGKMRKKSTEKTAISKLVEELRNSNPEDLLELKKAMQVLIQN